MVIIDCLAKCMITSSPSKTQPIHISNKNNKNYLVLAIKITFFIKFAFELEFIDILYNYFLRSYWNYHAYKYYYCHLQPT